MTYQVENNLTNFEFWSGAKANAEMLTYEELDQLDTLLEDVFGEIPTETQINDLFWFDFETVCELLGYRYDSEKDEIIREEEDEDEDDTITTTDNITEEESKSLINYLTENIEEFQVRFGLSMTLAYNHHTSFEVEDASTFERMCELAEEWAEDNDTEFEDVADFMSDFVFQIEF